MVRELCMGGAASRGMCYLGALQNLEDNGMLDDLEKMVTVSIGALIAACYIIGYTPKEMFKILLYKNTNDFKDISLDYVLNQGSVLKGEKYKTWIWEVLSKKVDPMITLKKLEQKYKKTLIMTATCLQDGLVIFSPEDTPDIPLFYAVLSSMALPFIFPPVRYKDKTYVDGGVLDNFPIRLLSDEALGLKVSSKQLDADFTSVFTYVAKLFQLISAQMRELLGVKGDIVIINANDYGFVDFDLDMDDKMTLYYRGYEEIIPYIEKTKLQEEKLIKQIVKELLDEIISNIHS